MAFWLQIRVLENARGGCCEKISVAIGSKIELFEPSWAIFRHLVCDVASKNTSNKHERRIRVASDS